MTCKGRLHHPLFPVAAKELEDSCLAYAVLFTFLELTVSRKQFFHVGDFTSMGQCIVFIKNSIQPISRTLYVLKDTCWPCSPCFVDYHPKRSLKGQCVLAFSRRPHCTVTVLFVFKPKTIFYLTAYVPYCYLIPPFWLRRPILYPIELRGQLF